METHAIKEMEIEGCNKQNILVVGEGDFSFSLSLAKILASDANITAASLDIREELGRNYCHGRVNVEELVRSGCNVVRNVNVHTMTSDQRLARYDLIVFHFPHAGKYRDVVSGFMESARGMSKNEEGEIYVTLTTIYPFNVKDMKKLAEEKDLRLIQKMKFREWTFSVCSNKRGESVLNHDYCFPIKSTLMFKK